LIQFLELLDNWIDLKNIFCINIIIKPIPNSTADNTRKKKVKDNKFMLSYIKPADKTIIYKVIHSNSAVKRRCNEFEGLITRLANKKKNRKKYKFKSPINKLYKKWNYKH
jgi:hypothetical protein